jgi:Porin subfamily
MRNILPLIISVVLLAYPVRAEQPTTGKLIIPSTPGKQLPLKGAGAANSCAAYGAGFIKVEGTDSCVRIGGTVRVDAVGAR